VSFCPECGYDTCKCNIFASPLRHPSLPELQRFADSYRQPILRSSLLPFEKDNLSYDLRVVRVKLTSSVPFWPKHLVIDASQAESVRVHDLRVGNVSFLPIGKDGDYIAGSFFSSSTPQAARFKLGMPRVSPGQAVVLYVSGTNFKMFVLQAAMQVELAIAAYYLTLLRRRT